MSNALIALADRLVRRMEFAPGAPQSSTPHRAHHKPFRPDIAEAIAHGEYEFMQLTNRKDSFRWRSVLMQVQRETRLR
jgi:hypothetical protein